MRCKYVRGLVLATAALTGLASPLGRSKFAEGDRAIPTLSKTANWWRPR